MTNSFERVKASFKARDSKLRDSTKSDKCSKNTAMKPMFVNCNNAIP